MGIKTRLKLKAPLQKSGWLIVKDGHILPPPKMASEASIAPYTLLSKELLC